MPILQWLNREESIRKSSKVPYRLLEVDDSLSYGDKDTENMLIQGDNLDALKALLPYYAGKVKCIYIDPPYNTGGAFQHYDDNLEHSIWLSLMYPRLELLRELLSDGGFICCQIDDAESHYLKILLDEVFGRQNYQTSLYFQVRYSNKTLAEDSNYQKVIEQCFVYSKGKSKPNKVKKSYSIEKFEWKITELSKGEPLELGGKQAFLFRKGEYKIEKINSSFDGLKETWATGSLIKQKKSSGEFLHLHIATRKDTDGLNCLYKVEGIGEDGLGYRYFTGPKKAAATKGKFYSGIPLTTLEALKLGSAVKEVPIPNFYDFSSSFGNCRHEGNADFRSGKKPESLLRLILDRFSNVGDLVLDSFLGSGSTAAVAHKMGRRYIGIEMGEHAKTHCSERLKLVVESDSTGISKELNWQGGGGFRFYHLGEPIFDDKGHINPKIKFDHLAAHVWFCETHTPFESKDKSAFLGIHNDVAYYLLYNGILGDKRPHGGNVLTNKILDTLPKHDGAKVIYGESSRISDKKLKALNITFKQTPYDVKSS
ncbi:MULTISPECIES: site-specific DNA-methyltransferase [Cysteiniphilum]|uniref:site-specific DNA-methyltransferase n=1 Tax=Cysteiniphilum TaxID=2056696 RepID=UPI00177E786A|nr:MULTISPECIES: site-specific DNA-methyltransferase [Cysteiniphilum]